MPRLSGLENSTGSENQQRPTTNLTNHVRTTARYSKLLGGRSKLSNLLSLLEPKPMLMAGQALVLQASHPFSVPLLKHKRCQLFLGLASHDLPITMIA